MAALATVAELAAWLGITLTGGSDDDLRAQQILDSISGAARRTARQTFDQVADDEADLAGTWDAVLDLPEKPVTAVSAVEIDGTALTSDQYELIANGRLYRVGRWADSSLKHLTGGTWGGPLATVTVTYTHGWASVPEDVKAVVLAAAARAWANPQGALYESVGSYRIGFSNATQTAQLTEFEVELLKSYRPRP